MKGTNVTRRTKAPAMLLLLTVKIARHLNPGGSIELQDISFPWLCDDPQATEHGMIIKWERSPGSIKEA
jgi:hypothetical protein